MKSVSKIIIIGTGAAGLGAGMELKKIKETLKDDVELDIEFIEARNRVGGRCVTQYYGIPGEEKKEFPIDIGACWIEGLKGNPIAKLCRERNYNIIGGKGGFVLSDYDGGGINRFDMKTVRDRFSRCFKMSRKDANKLPKGKDVSIQEGMEKYLKQFKWTEKQKRILNYVQSGKEQYNGGTCREFSGKKFGTGPSFGGGEGYVKEGIGQLFEDVFKELEIPCKFEHVVREINYEGKMVKLVTDKGNFEADYVISTLPLGVLKHKLVKFVPELPKSKEKSIKNLGYGLMNKLVLVFPEKFWNDDVHSRIGYIADDKKARWRFWMSLSGYHQNNKKLPIFICLLSCDFAKEMEKLSTEEVVKDAMVALRKVFKKKKIPEPVEYHISKWEDDPYSKGGYTFLGVNSSTKDCKELSVCLSNKLFFAGEHTSQYYSAIHGGWLSGEREAQKIIKLITNNQ